MSFLVELEEIAEHFHDVNSAIHEFFGQILGGDYHNRPDWVNYQNEDIRHIFALRLLENERAVSLTVLAALESWFRMDCQTRAEKREKSPIGQQFKKMYATGGRSIAKIRFHDILDTWSDFDPTSKQIIIPVKEAFKYRHWLAHGRYWTLKAGRKYDFDIIYAIAKNAAALLVIQ